MGKRKLIPLVLAMIAGTSIAYAAPQYDLGEVIVTATRLEEKHNMYRHLSMSSRRKK